MIGEIEGVSQGIMFSNIPERTYYLSFGGCPSTGNLKILSIEELK